MKKVFDITLSFLPFLIVFVSALYNPTDPDLGWHLKYGEHFFKTGQILRDNTFSVMMPDYKWANTSWGTDLITYSAFNLGGFFALTLLGALTVTLTFFFLAKAAELSIWDKTLLFPLLVYLVGPLNSVSFRGQQISLLFLGILFWIIHIRKKNSKYIFLTIPLFLLWANLHGEFILGLVMFLCWMFIYLVQKILTGVDWNNWIQSVKVNIIDNKKEIGTLISIFLLCMFSTLINPFGIGIHQDALKHIGDPLLKKVVEYIPFSFFSNGWWKQVVIAILLGVGVVFLFFKNKLFYRLPELASTVLLYILSFFVRRFAWPAFYLVLPILKPLPGFLKPDSKNVTKFTALVILIITLSIVTMGKMPLDRLQTFEWLSYCDSQAVPCSPDSAEYLSDKKLTGNLFSIYNWGGYIIWNHPDIKPTIDGRMHLWRKEDGYSAFEEFYAVEQNIKDIDKTKYDIVYTSPKKPIANRMVELVNSGRWKTVYKDNHSGVFVRN